MASAEENLVFGDFEDLSAEESKRIYHILYGQKSQYANKVEFPWDSGAEEVQGAVGGVTGQSWLYDVGNFEGTATITFLGDGFINKDGSFSAPFGLDEVPEEPGLPDSSEASASSKLQASLKPYERRNKKKRPRDYYDRQSMEKDEQGEMEDQSNSPYTVIPEPVQSVPVTRAEYQSDAQINLLPRQPYINKVGDIQNVGVHSDSGDNVNRRIPMQVSSHNSGVHSEIPIHPGSVHSTYTASATSGANVRDYPYPNNDELCEVVVEPCPSNPANVLATTETYKVQDHERTSSESYSSNNVMDVECNSEGVSNVQMQATAIPNSVSVISGVNNDAERHVSRVDVSVKDAPAAVFPSQDMNQQQDFTNLPHSETGTSVQSDGQDENSSISFMETDGSVCGKVPVEIDSSNTSASSETVQSGPASSVWDAPKPKAKTWAALFKGSAGPSDVQEVAMVRSSDSSERVQEDERQEKEYSPLPVPAAEDSNAKQLGELLSKMCITHSSMALQPRGLINRGNWCYINGTLQALVACPPFYNLLKRLPRYPALSRGPSSTPILDAMVEFVHEFQAMPRIDKGDRSKKVSKDVAPGVPFEPAYVYKMLQTIAVNPHFKLGKQEDAEEFLSCILDGMHEEMSAVVNHSRPQLQEASVEEEGVTNGFVHGEEGEEDSEEEEQWEQVGPKKKSVFTRRPKFAKTPIADIFAGMVRSAVYKEKSKETATLEPFFTLQLDIQSDKVWSVKEALEGLVSSEPVSGYTCPKTNAEVEVTKKLSLEELPPVLILHLKFFVYNKDGGSQKLMKRVDYPVELEITKELLSPNARNKLREQQRTYKLFAVVYHHGKAATGGHYTTSVFQPGINGWVHSDDSAVRTFSVAQVLKYQPPRVPYLLYYRRLDSH